jgi:hypothetical protein
MGERKGGRLEAWKIGRAGEWRFEDVGSIGLGRETDAKKEGVWKAEIESGVSCRVS